MFQHRAFFLSCALSLSLVACGEDDKPAEDCGTMCAEDSLEVVGEWDTNFGTSETITETTWGDFQNVVFFDNDANVAVTQNAEDADFDPGLFNRIEWTEIEADVFYYCTATFGEESEQAALEASATVDSSDLEGAGCGGFSWTMMTRK